MFQNEINRLTQALASVHRRSEGPADFVGWLCEHDAPPAALAAAQEAAAALQGKQRGRRVAQTLLAKNAAPHPRPKK